MKNLFLTITLFVSSICFSQTSYNVNLYYSEVGNVTSDSTVEWVSRDSINKIITINEGVSLEMDSTVYKFIKQDESNPSVYTFSSVNEKTKQMCSVTYFKMCGIVGNVMGVIIDVDNKTYYYVGKLN